MEETLNKVEGLKVIAKELDVPLAQMALAWCAKNPHVSSVITGATKEHQVNGSVRVWNQIFEGLEHASLKIRFCLVK